MQLTNREGHILAVKWQEHAFLYSYNEVYDDIELVHIQTSNLVTGRVGMATSL
jgi:hypothetical protein